MQTILALLIVLAATGYSVWKLAPASLRHRFAARSGAIARAGGASESLARRIEIKAVHAAENAAGCGNCGPCKGCATGRSSGEDPPSA
ncbi:MAG: DUF6587 family protein [Burkholderiaceae bacterium]